MSAPSASSRWRACPTPSSSCGRRSSMRCRSRGSRRRLGRRRAWLVATQLALMATIVWLGTRDPVTAPLAVGVGALMVAFASATQDIVIDAFRVESLSVDEQAAGMAGYVAAYRIGMLASGAGVVVLTAWLEARGLEQDGGVADRLRRRGAAGRWWDCWPCCLRASRRLARPSVRARTGRMRSPACWRRPATPSPSSCRAMRRSRRWPSSCSTSSATRWPAP